MRMTQQVIQRVKQLTTNNGYINQLIADMYDREDNNRDITPADITRLKDVVFNHGYLHDIAVEQILGEQEDPTPCYARYC